MKIKEFISKRTCIVIIVGISILVIGLILNRIFPINFDENIASNALVDMQLFTEDESQPEEDNIILQEDTDIIRDLPVGYIYEIRFRINDDTDRVHIRRFDDLDYELTAHDLFMVWDEEYEMYVNDITYLDRFDVTGTRRIKRIAWTPVRQNGISNNSDELGLSLQIGDTIRDLWHSPNFHKFFIRGAGYDYILNVYAYWVWE